MSENDPESSTAEAHPQSSFMQQQLQLMQQMLELQRENNELRRSNSHAPSSSSSTNARKPDRPIIEPDSSDNDWALFVDSWTRYKDMCRLSDPSDIRNELRSCCSTEVNRLLFDLVGSERLNISSESDLMAHMKSVAVKGMHVEVHRQTFHSMKQSEGETITHFLARLRSQASFCNFNVQCPNTTVCNQKVSYAEDMIAGQMIAGLINTEHQAKILAQAATLVTLKQKFDLLISLETTDKSTSKLNVPPATTPRVPPSESSYQKSDYKKTKNPPKGQKTDIRPCTGCGKTSHPGKSLRRKDCPAFKIICRTCGITGHFEDVCKRATTPTDESSKNAAQTGDDMATSSIFSQISGSNTKKSIKNRRRRQIQASKKRNERESLEKHRQLDFVRKVRRSNNRHGRSSKSCPAQSIVIPHLEWDGQKFVEAPPRPSPSLDVHVEIMHQAHESFGRKLSSKSTVESKDSLAFADSGAQTCSSGTEILDLLRCPEKYLIPTSHRIRGITSSHLKIKGALLLLIRVGNRETRQVVYVSENSTGLYLSESALIDLGLIPESFPSIPSDSMSQHNSDKAKCGCHLRTEVPERPDSIPFAPTIDNREKLEHWIRDFFKGSALNTCPHQPLQTMTGKPMDISFKPETTPFAVHTPIPVPHHWKRRVKLDIDRDVQLGIIEPVPVGTPTIWCSRMIVAPKKDGSPRRTVDLQKLNSATRRETHHTPSPYNQASVVPPHKKKTVLDAWNGYHSLPLSPNARDATSFITEWGRYRYLRAPQGFHASGDAYTRRFDDITVDFPRKTRCIDDSLLWDDDIEQSFWHTIDYIRHCAINGIVFNPDKFQFAMDVVDFAGFTLTEDGLKPTKRMIEAILNFPTPRDLRGMRSWFGLVNQVAYAFSQAETMAPFRELLSSKRKFYWDDTLDHLFQQSKQHIISQIEEGVKSFEVHRPTCISSDYSKTGISYFLSQKHCSCDTADGPYCGDGHWKLVTGGSRFTTPPESHYAPVEGEALALTYGLENCRIFVLGCPDLLLAVDHKPLVSIFSDQPFERVSNPRLFDFKEKTLMYRFTVKHVPGKIHLAPDCGSRYPVSSPTDSIDAGIRTSISASYASDNQLKAVTWDRIRSAAAIDEECRVLSTFICNGFPETKNEIPACIRQFWPMRHDLYQLDGVPVKGTKIFIPKSLRAEILESLHAAHQGVNGMMANARQRLFWPGLDASIRLVRAQCKVCNSMAPSNPKQPLAPPSHPDYPFQQTVTDFFDLHGNDYLIYADRYTGWVEIALMTSSKAQIINDTLRKWFTTYGAPEELSSDGGPPFNSHEYDTFLRNWGVRKRLSAAYYPQSNGRAELAVKSAKRILSDNVSGAGRLNHDKVARALLNHRNTPVADLNISPAVMLFGRPIRDHLPALLTTHSIRPEWTEIRNLREAAFAKRHMRNEYFYNHGTKQLSPLVVGDFVQVQNQHGTRPRRWYTTGRIVEVLDHDQYRVRIHGSNRITLRNRRFLRKILPVSDSSSFPETTPQHITLDNELAPRNHDVQTDLPVTLITDSIPTTEHQIQPPSPPSTPASPNLLLPTPLPTQSTLPIIQPASPQSPQTNAEPVTSDEPHVSPHKASIPPIIETPQPPIRRSTRTTRPRRALSPQMRGKSHNYSDV